MTRVRELALVALMLVIVCDPQVWVVCGPLILLVQAAHLRGEVHRGRSRSRARR
jgi:hypothetical protein